MSRNGNFRLITGQPAIRTPVTATALVAGAQAATTPFQAVIGIEFLGLTAAHYSLLVVLTSIIGLTVTLLGGMLIDRLRLRKLPLLVFGLAGVLSALLFVTRPSVATYSILLTAGVPFVNASYSSLISETRRGAEKVCAPDRARSVSVAARSVVSLMWIAVPPVTGFLVGAGREYQSWAFGFILLTASLIVIFSLDTRTDAGSAPSPAETGPPAPRNPRSRRNLPVVLGVLATGFLIAPHRLGGIILPLMIVGPLQGTLFQVGLASGLIAALEIPFILIAAALIRSISSRTMLLAGAALLCVYVSLLSGTTSLWQAYALLLPAAAGGAVALSMPVTFVQDVLHRRAGLAIGVIASVSLIANMLATAAFSLSGPFGIQSVSVTGSLLFLTAGTALMLTARRMSKSGG